MTRKHREREKEGGTKKRERILNYDASKVAPMLNRAPRNEDVGGGGGVEV